LFTLKQLQLNIILVSQSMKSFNQHVNTGSNLSSTKDTEE